MKPVYDFCLTWSREAHRFFRDSRLVTLLLIVPILYVMLFGQLYSQHRVREVPTVVQDSDRTPLSRQIMQALNATETFDVRGSVANIQQFREMNWRGKAFVCVVIPQGLQQDIAAGRPARVLAVVDGSNMIIATAATRGVSEVLQTYFVGLSLRKWSARGVPAHHTGVQAMPLETGLRLWYNPTFNYTNFLLIGLVGAVLQQVVLLAVALARAKDHEENTLEELRRQVSHPVAAAHAKLTFYFMVSFGLSVGLFILPVGAFHVPLRGDAGILLIATALFVLGLVGLGTFISSLTISQLLRTQILMMIGVPSFLLSGFTWPLFAMPGGIRWFAEVLPLTHYLTVLRNTATSGAGWAPNLTDLRWLFGFAATAVALQCIGVWWRLSATPIEKTTLEGDYAGTARIQATNRA